MPYIMQFAIASLVKKLIIGGVLRRTSSIFHKGFSIRLKSGQEYHCQIDVPKGDYRKPMSDEEIALKYRDCARFVVPSKNREDSLKLLQSLENLPKIEELMNIIR